MKMKLSTYVAGQQLPAHHFFILNKGMNAGKPADVPWTNSFVAQFETLEERDYFFWICYGLWSTEKFKTFLIGTAIPYIRKNDLWTVLDLAEANIHGKKDFYYEAISMLFEAQKHCDVLANRISSLESAKEKILKLFVFI